MIFDVSHRTTYSYARPVLRSEHVVHVTPQSGPRQTVHRHNLLIEPAPAAKIAITDYFGNAGAILTIEEEHSELVVHARSTVEVHARDRPIPGLSTAWELVPGKARRGNGDLDVGVLQFTSASRHTRVVPEAIAYAREVVSLGAGISYMSSTQGDVRLEGIVGFPDATTSQLVLNMDVDLKTIRYPQAGISWDAKPWLTLAATYRGGFKLVLDQTFDIRGDIGTPGSPPLVDNGYLHLRSIAQDLFQPAQLTAAAHAARVAGLNIWPVDRTTAGFEVAGLGSIGGFKMQIEDRAKQRKKRLSLRMLIMQSGLDISIQTFWVFSVVVGVGGYASAIFSTKLGLTPWLGLLLGVPQIDDESGQLYLYAGVVVLGTLVQLLLPIPWLRRLDGSLTLVLDWRDPAVKRVLVLMLPVTLTIGLVNVNFVVDTLFASRLLDPELAPAAIDKAFRLYMLPQGMFAVAVTTVLFPTLARLAARDDMGALRRTLDSGLRQIAFLLVPAGLFSIVLAEPIVRLVYQRGEFTADDTVIVAQCLQAFSIGLVFNGWMAILNRSFYAIQTNWVPTGIALGAVGLNALANLVFYRLGIWGIPLATSTVNIVASGVLLVMMRRRLGLEHVRGTLGVVARVAVAGGVAAGLAFAAWYGLDELLGRGLIAQVVSLGSGLAVGGLAYLGLARALGLRELEALLLLRTQRG